MLAIAALAMFLFAVLGCAHPAPPPGAIASQAFNDGVNAARRDMSQGRPPRVDRHARFRNPPAHPGASAHIYRQNFRRGYVQTYRNGR